MRKVRFLVGVGLLVLSVVNVPALGAMLALEFAGTITSWVDPQNVLGLDASRAFSGRFIYDSSWPDTSPDPAFGAYAPPVVTCTVGTVTVGGGGLGKINVINGPSLDGLIFETYGFQSGGFTVKDAQVVLGDPTSHALADDRLPGLSTNLSGFSDRRFTFKLDIVPYAQGVITSCSIVAVPEPTTSILGGSAVLLLKRRRPR